jgi:FMN phosphatase YigB (HAD superfamily)
MSNCSHALQRVTACTAGPAPRDATVASRAEAPDYVLAAVRAVICDIYGTLLEVGPPPENADAIWEEHCHRIAGSIVPLEDFNARCRSLAAQEINARRCAGERFPDVTWLDVLGRAFDPLLEPSRAPELSNCHASCVRTCTAIPGAVAALETLHANGVRLGLASNAQDYTRRELARAGFALTLFHPRFCFLSGEHGFAKPSPRVFALLTERLAEFGIAPRETLMVGDSIDNDITPAAAAGWQTWHIDPDNPGRSWERLAAEMQRF